MFSFLKWNDLHGPVSKALLEDINNLLKSNPLDDAIKSMEITDIDFGHIPPTLDILDISEPPEERRGFGAEIFRTKTTPFGRRRKRKSYSSYGLASALNNMTSDNKGTKGGESGVRVLRQKSNPFSSSAQRLSGVNELKKFYAQYPQRICSFKRSHPRFERRNRELRGMYNPFSERRQIEEEIWKSLDVQIKSFFSYVGNLRVSISTTFQLNEPVKNFLEVPLHVSVSNVKIAFLCVLIYRGGKDQVEIYLKPSPLTKYFDLAIELGDETDVFVDESLIGNFLKRNIDLFLEERLIFPNRIRINGLAKRIEGEVRAVMEEFSFGKKSKKEGKRKRRRRKKKEMQEEEEEEDEGEEDEDDASRFFRRKLVSGKEEEEGEGDGKDDKEISSSDSDRIGKKNKRE